MDYYNGLPPDGKQARRGKCPDLRRRGIYAASTWPCKHVLKRAEDCGPKANQDTARRGLIPLRKAPGHPSGWGRACIFDFNGGNREDVAVKHIDSSNDLWGDHVAALVF